MKEITSFKAQINNFAKKNHVSAQAVLQNYMLERLLERIILSEYHDNFILKGGMLISSLVGISNRTTMDMDITIQNSPLIEEKLFRTFSDICTIETNDEVAFSVSNISPIRNEDIYGGYRLSIIATYKTITTPLKVDITVGDIITPQPIRYEFPSIFEKKEFSTWAYNLETILAEKVETVLRRDIFNTRPRDFYDIYIILNKFENSVDKELFLNALFATAKKRNSLEGLDKKEIILDRILADSEMQKRWNIYSVNNFYARDLEFDKIISKIRTYIS
jgi:predicted nucleotidyltransferase component of viral defense system